MMNLLKLATFGIVIGMTATAVSAAPHKHKRAMAADHMTTDAPKTDAMATDHMAADAAKPDAMAADHMASGKPTKHAMNDAMAHDKMATPK